MNSNLKIILIVIAILFAIFVWPTIYRYDHVRFGGGTELPIRTNRFTGQSEIFRYNGWETLGNKER